MRKTVTAALIAALSTLPFSFALAAPQHAGAHGGGHEPPSMPHMNNDTHGDAMSTAAHAKSTSHMNNDAHGDAVSTAAHAAKASGTNVGKAVSPVASARNRGHHRHHGHHHGHH